MSISVPEIIAALRLVTNEPEIETLIASPHGAKFIEFCCILYDRGFEHGYSSANSDANERAEKVSIRLNPGDMFP